ILAGATVSAQEYLGTLQRRAAMKVAYAAALEGIDALLTPTTECAAVALSEVDEAHLPSRFTRFGNLLDLCALALPNGFTSAGLPLSLQITCRGYGEAMALRIGQAYQQATDWHRRRPPV
ncbi:MAG: amidase family protein, partial [Hyphomicrobiaceae bacterium]